MQKARWLDAFLGWSARSNHRSVRVAALLLAATLLASCGDTGAAEGEPGSLKAHVNGQAGFYTGVGFGGNVIGPK